MYTFLWLCSVAKVLFPEIQLLSRFLCYSKLFCSLGFWIEESFVTGFNESES